MYLYYACKNGILKCAVVFDIINNVNCRTIMLLLIIKSNTRAFTKPGRKIFDLDWVVKTRQASGRLYLKISYTIRAPSYYTLSSFTLRHATLA